MSEWSGFAQEVNSSGGVKITKKPTAGSFVSVLDQAITFYLEYEPGHAASKLQALPQTVKTTSPTVTLPEELKPAKGLSEGDVDAAFNIFSDLETKE